MAQMGLGRFRSSNEADYLSDREKFINEQDKNFIADNPFLFGTRLGMQNMLARIELFNMVKNVSGAIVDCGVASGNSLMLYSLLSMVKEPYALNRKIIGFDTFEGFRSLTADEKEKGLTENDFGNCSYDILKTSRDIYDIDRPLGHMNRVQLIKGDACETIPKYVEDHPELTIAMLYLDFDIYTPTLVALQNLYCLVAKGGIVAFDEFNYENFSGETKAVKDFFGSMNKLGLRRFEYDSLTAYMKVE
jgi:hypothetical protein